MARGVTDEEDAVGGRVSKLVRNPVALVSDRLTAELFSELDGRLLDVETRVEGTDPDAHLIGGRKAPSVTGGYHRSVDPDLQIAPVPEGMYLEAARERGGRGLVAARAEDPPPPEPVDDEWGAELAAVCHDHHRPRLGPGPSSPVSAFTRRAPDDGRRLELCLVLTIEQGTKLAVVEGGEAPRQPIADRRVGCVDYQIAEGLLDRSFQAKRFEPHCRRGAGGGLAFTDVITIEHQHSRAPRAGTCTGKLARNR